MEVESDYYVVCANDFCGYKNYYPTLEEFTTGQCPKCGDLLLIGDLLEDQHFEDLKDKDDQ